MEAVHQSRECLSSQATWTLCPFLSFQPLKFWNCITLLTRTVTGSAYLCTSSLEECLFSWHPLHLQRHQGQATWQSWPAPEEERLFGNRIHGLVQSQAATGVRTVLYGFWHHWLTVTAHSHKDNCLKQKGFLTHAHKITLQWQIPKTGKLAAAQPQPVLTFSCMSNIVLHFLTLPCFF